MAAPTKTLIKLSWGQRALLGLLTGLGRNFIIRPIITTLSGVMIWLFNGLLRRYPHEAAKMAGRIQSIYFDASNAWVMFAKDYMETMTGKQISPEIIDNLIGSNINLTGKALAQNLGEAFLLPMLNMILPGTPDWNAMKRARAETGSEQFQPVKILQPTDGLLGAERFLGINLQFQLQAWMLHFIGDTVSMGNMKSLKDLPNAISWSYGIGWLSWLVMGTPFRFTIADPLEKLLSMLYRTKDLSVAQAIDAYNSGYIDNEEFWRIMREAGYEDEIVPILRDQGATRLTTSVLEREYLQGRITKDLVIEELRRRGYTTGRITRIIDNWEYSRYDKIMERWAEECIDAYEKGLMDEIDLREALVTAGWSDQEKGDPINLQIKTSQLRRAQSGRFTKTELRSLYGKQLITRGRVLTELGDMGYSRTPDPGTNLSDAELLILSWE